MTPVEDVSFGKYLEVFVQQHAFPHGGNIVLTPLSGCTTHPSYVRVDLDQCKYSWNEVICNLMEL